MDPEKHKCIFCLSKSASFSREEHIIPESLGGDKVLPKGLVCDKCNQYLAKIENEALTKSVLSMARSLMGFKTKKKKYTRHQGFGVEAIGTENGPAFNFMSKEHIQSIVNKGGGCMRFVDPGRRSFLTRLLIKMGLEMVTTSNELNVYDELFDKAREAVRSPKRGLTWKLVLTYRQPDDFCEVIQTEEGPALKEQVYEYSLLRSQKDGLILFVFDYWIFMFIVPLSDGDFNHVINLANENNLQYKYMEIKEIDLTSRF